VIDREVRNALIACDPHSTDLLKPFLVGENLKRWHVESDDLWLIYTPKNRVNIEDYPAIRDHLAVFRDRLEARATKQHWWELQQAQAAYERHFRNGKIVYPEMSQGPKFSIVRGEMFLSNKCFFVPAEDEALTASLGSKASWLWLFGEASPLRGGQWRLELREQYVSRLPVPSDSPDFQNLAPLARAVQAAHEELFRLSQTTLHRLGDVAQMIETAAAFRKWFNMDFNTLRTAISKRFRTDFSVPERDEWERWYENRRANAVTLNARITDAEAEINDRVYSLYGLDRDDVAAIEESLAGQY
ncbi:MAG: hypothetical protein ACT4OE_08420, partial [Sphingosinicella sp.]